MNAFLRTWRPALAASLAALLAACGGGDGASPAATAPATVLQQAVAPPAEASAAKSAPLAAATSQDAEGRRGTARSQPSNSLYIVQLADMPVTAYTGGVRGLGATKPARGGKIDPNAPAVQAYMGYLASRHGAAMSSVGASRKLYSYGYVFNGFAAELTEAQAQRMAQVKGVIAVTKDEARPVNTSSTPAFLGLSGPAGFWAATGATGENVIIGIVDGGIWPEHPSFSDRTGGNGNGSQDGKLGYQQIAGWHGRCVPGEAFNASDCNGKLIGARYYNAGFGGNAGIDAAMPWEFNSPRDWGGHGTHTASTAGGNSGVAATGPAALFGSISGMAPRARIAAYKSCWDDGAGGSCFTSDSVAAIDQAVADGVDVINFSVSGSRTSFRDPVEIAFLFAADAGVFVATSAGNSGPAASTVAHGGPWVTTVAAGTHPRSASGSVQLGNGATYFGASTNSVNLAASPLVDATTAGLAGADPAKVRLCYAASDNGGVAVLDPAKIAGKVVVCDRGVTARTSKSLAVQQAGGVGMVLVNTSLNSLNGDFHAVPSVHLAHTDRAAVKAYAATASPTAAIPPATVQYDAAAPYVASFSSRGPLLAGDGDLLKPDIIAPGQDILAAVAPPGNSGRSFDLYSGTSMSSPHIAGIAALFKQARPGWSPMAIKSALMTTAGDVLDGPNTSASVIFGQGAGHVRPSRALDPGLVFDSGFAEWLGFLCGTQLPVSFCTSAGVPVVQARNMNVPSIAFGNLPGVQSVTRRVTNVGGAPATYTASAAMPGFIVAVSPAALTVAPGETKAFTVTLTRTDAAPLNTYGGGQLTWSDGTHTVRIPMVAKPVALGAPMEVGGSYTVSFGYTGSFTAQPRGLLPAVQSPGSVATGGQVDFPVVVPVGTSYARFSLFDTAVSQPSDLDLEVYLDGTLVGASGGGTTAEEVNLLNPAAGTYTVRVVGYAVPSGAANFTLYSWALGTASAGNMTVSAPATATLGTQGTVTIATSGLVAGRKYLGSVVYGGTAGMPAPTIVRIDP